jgi:hypothetical protein
MPIAKKTPIKDLLNAQEKKSLEQIYKSYKVPTDQLRRCPDVLRAIASAFERVESRRIEPSTLLRYMFNRRKLKDWPKLGQRAQKFESLLHLLPLPQLTALEKIYERFRQPVDNYQFRPTLMRELAVEFRKVTGVDEDGEVLVTVMTARRKRGLWPALFEELSDSEKASSSGAFSDIEEVHRKYKTGS